MATSVIASIVSLPFAQGIARSITESKDFTQHIEQATDAKPYTTTAIVGAILWIPYCVTKRLLEDDHNIFNFAPAIRPNPKN